MKEATINAKQAGERGISAKSVKKVTAVLLASPSTRIAIPNTTLYSMLWRNLEAEGLGWRGYIRNTPNLLRSRESKVQHLLQKEAIS